MKVRHGSSPDLPCTLPDVAVELRGIVVTALERDKSQRFSLRTRQPPPPAP
jgi:hypothetical protein